MTESSENTDRPLRFLAAFERLAPEIRAVEDDRLIPINLDVPSVVATAIGVATKLHALRDDLLKHLPTFDIERFDALDTYAGALGHAQIEYQIATEPPPSVLELAASVSRIRMILLNDLNTLIARDLLPETVLKNVKGGTGYKAFAFDVLALAGLYRHHWAKLSPFTAVKVAELDQAVRDAEILTKAVGDREQSPIVLAQVAHDRQAAFTLLIDLYDEIRSAVAYLRHKQGDAEALAPSLYSGRAAPKRSSQSTEEKSEPEAVPPPTASGTTSTDHVPAAKPAAASTGPYA